jgi:transposase
MGRAYSQDLRLRVLEAIDDGLSKMQAHQTFRVSRSTIDDWLRLRAEQGHVRDKAVLRTKAGGALGDTEVFGAFAARQSGATLKQMAEVWQDETGQELSINTFSLALQRLGWTRKKRVFSTASAMPYDAKSSSNN